MRRPESRRGCRSPPIGQAVVGGTLNRHGGVVGVVEAGLRARLDDLAFAAEQRLVGRAQGLAHAVQHASKRAVGAELELALQLKGADALLHVAVWRMPTTHMRSGILDDSITLTRCFGARYLAFSGVSLGG